MIDKKTLKKFKDKMLNLDLKHHSNNELIEDLQNNIKGELTIYELLNDQEKVKEKRSIFLKIHDAAERLIDNQLEVEKLTNKLHKERKNNVLKTILGEKPGTVLKKGKGKYSEINSEGNIVWIAMVLEIGWIINYGDEGDDWSSIIYGKKSIQDKNLIRFLMRCDEVSIDIYKFNIK